MSSGFNYMIIGLGLIAISFAVWKELRRQSGKNLLWRIVTSIFAILALIELMIPIRISRAPDSRGRQAIVLTEGHREDSLRNFIAGLQNQPSFIDAAHFVGLGDSNFQSIHVFGYGLSEEDLKPLSGLPLQFHPNPAPAGFQTAYWERKLALGKPLRLQGTFRNNLDKRVKIILTGMGNRFDSSEISTTGSANFTLEAIPRQLGRAVYQLIVVSGKDTVEKEPIPFETVPARNLNVLILASSPGFENKFLSQWLAKQGYGVVMRSLISSHKSENTFLNLKPQSLNMLNSSFLNTMDLLISDPTALNALPSSEMNAVRSQVEDGMGLVVQADSITSASAWYISPFKLSPATHLNSGSLQVRTNDDNAKAYPIMADQAVFLRPEAATQAWAKDSANRIIVGSSLYGQGKKVLVTLPRTYPWILSGKEDAYANFWSQLIEKSSRQTRSVAEWSFAPAFSATNDQVEVTRFGNPGKTETTFINEITLAMEQDPLLSFQWHGRYWPLAPGWHAALPAQGEISWWWAFDQQDWLAPRQNLKLKATNEFILNNRVMSEPVIPPTAKTPLSRIFPFLIFLACCIFLWIESKLYGERN